MGIENKLDKLLTPTDSLCLCEGFFRDAEISYQIVTEKNLLDAGQVLIEIGYQHDRPYKSRCDVIETALSMGWYPDNWDGPYIKAAEFDAQFDSGQDVLRWLDLKKIKRFFSK